MYPSTAPILVTGANGRTGRAVLRALAAAGKRARAFIRVAAQADALTALGAPEIAIGDLSDAATIQAAAQGCQAIVHIGPPMHPQEVEMTTRVMAAAASAGVAHFVYYSVMHSLRRDVRHHRLKLDCEERIVGSSLCWTILQPARYMQHLAPIWSQVLSSGVHRMPFNTTVRFNVVDLEDLAAAVASVAGDAQFAYGTYELAGPEALNQEDMAAIIGRVLGRKICAAEQSLDQLDADARAKGLSADRIEQMRIMNSHYSEHGFRGNPRVLAMLLGRAPTVFETYVRRLNGATSRPG